MLWMLAVDHRQSFRAIFDGLDRAARDPRIIPSAKRVVFDGLLLAIERGVPDSGRAALLVDEAYGADIIADAKARGITVAAPIEASGRRELAFEHGDDGFGSAIERVAPSFVKVLVRYTPADIEVNARQRARLLALQQWLTAHHQSWMLELLVPAGLGDRDGYDETVRPQRTVDAIDELRRHGIDPDLWKLEGMPTAAAYAAAAEACAHDDSAARCLVLGRGRDMAAVERWLTLAAPMAGFDGFAVGRTIWWDPLRSWLDGIASSDDAAAAIATNYLHLIEVFRAARATAQGAALGGNTHLLRDL